MSTSLNSTSSPRQDDGGEVVDCQPFSRSAFEKLTKRFPTAEVNGFRLFNQDFTINVNNVVLQDQLAKGSYGTVYAGSYNSEKVVVKIEQLGAGDVEQVNILTELTVLQSISHGNRNLVQYYGAGKLHKSPSEAKIMMLLEECENGALRERLFDTELSWSLVTRLALDIANGLKSLHEHNLVHRDIKTTNVLIDKDWRAKICDFSFGVQVGNTGTVAPDEFVYGTTEFMAPEVALGEEFDVSADIFSFGIVLCEMMCKCAPSTEFLHRQPRDFFALDADELRRSITHDCPESLEALALQCCETDSLKRPHASECVEWLEDILKELHEDHDRVAKALPEPSSDISVPMGVMNANREGSVKYPKTPKVTAKYSPDSNLRKRVKQEDSTLASDEIPQPILKMFHDMHARVSYLEIQVQELRAENSSLTKELTAIQHDYLVQHQKAEQQNALAALSLKSDSSHTLDGITMQQQIPRSYTSRIVNPGSPNPPSSSAQRGLHSSNLSKVAMSCASRISDEDQHDNLAEKVSSVEKCVHVLLSEVEELKRGGVEPDTSANDQLPSNETRDSSDDHSNVCDNKFLDKTSDKLIEEAEIDGISQRGHSMPVTKGGGVDSLSVVIDSFLQVVDKCSNTKHHSLKVLSDIDNKKVICRSKNILDRDVDEGHVNGAHDKSATSTLSPTEKRTNTSTIDAKEHSKVLKSSRQKSFLSQPSPIEEKVAPRQPSKSRKTPKNEKHVKDGVLNSSNGNPTSHGLDEEKGQSTVWRDIPSEHREDLNSFEETEEYPQRSALGSDRSSCVDLSFHMVDNAADSQSKTNPRYDNYNFHQESEMRGNFRSSPPAQRKSCNSGHMGIYDRDSSWQSRGKMEPKEYFRGDQLYNYVFRRDSSTNKICSPGSNPIRNSSQGVSSLIGEVSPVPKSNKLSNERRSMSSTKSLNAYMQQSNSAGVSQNRNL